MYRTVHAIRSLGLGIGDHALLVRVTRSFGLLLIPSISYLFPLYTISCICGCHFLVFPTYGEPKLYHLINFVLLMTEAPLCALTEDVGLLYVSLALSCMPSAIFLAPISARPLVPISSSGMVSNLNRTSWHPPVGGSAVVASPLLDGSRFKFQHRSSHGAISSRMQFCCFSQSSCLRCLACSSWPP